MDNQAYNQAYNQNQNFHSQNGVNNYNYNNNNYNNNGNSTFGSHSMTPHNSTSSNVFNQNPSSNSSYPSFNSHNSSYPSFNPNPSYNSNSSSSSNLLFPPLPILSQNPSSSFSSNQSFSSNPSYNPNSSYNPNQSSSSSYPASSSNNPSYPAFSSNPSYNPNSSSSSSSTAANANSSVSKNTNNFKFQILGDDNKIISSEELLQSVQNAKSEGVLFQLLGAEIFNVQAKSGDISYEKCAASDIFVVADYLKRNGNSEMEEPVKIIKEYLTEILKKSFDFDSPLAKSIPGRVKEKAGKYAPEFLVPLEKIEKEKLAEMNKAAEEVKNKVEPEEEKVAEGKAEVIQNYKRGSFARREAMLRQKKDDLAKRKAAMAKRKTELETAATWPNIKVTRLPISSIDPNSPHLYECLWQTKFCPAFLVENTDSNQEFQEASVAEMAKICGKDRKNATVSQKEAAKVVLEYMRENIKIAVDKSSTVAEHLSYVAGLFDHSPNSQME